jgi:hypothetical protein
MTSGEIRSQNYEFGTEFYPQITQIAQIPEPEGNLRNLRNLRMSPSFIIPNSYFLLHFLVH